VQHVASVASRLITAESARELPADGKAYAGGGADFSFSAAVTQRK